MTPLKVPTVHLNGTSRDSLVEQYSDAAQAVTRAAATLGEAYPNGRDYYPQGPGALQEAMRAVDERHRVLIEIATELNTLAELIADGRG